MINFYTYQLTKLFLIIFSLNITCIQSVGTILKKSGNDDINLYSNFNKRLSAVSNSARKHMEEAAAPYLDKLYKTNNEIINELEKKRKEQHKPKKIHNYYDYNQDFGKNNYDVDDNGVGDADDDTEVIRTNLNRLLGILGKGKNKKVDDYDDDDQEEVIRVNGGRDENENNNVGEDGGGGGGGGGDDDDDSDDAINDDSNNSEANNNVNNELPMVAKNEPTSNVEIEFQKPILEPTIIKTDKGTPTEEDVSNWVKENPEKFQTFVHAMYVMKNRDNRKIKHEISCLIYCDRLKGRAVGLVGELNGKRCVCKGTKKRREVENSILMNNPGESPNHDIVKRTNEIPPISPSSSSSVAAASLSSSPAKQENPLKSSGNLLNINENINSNNNKNNEDKNQMDEDKFNGNLIETIIKQLRDEKAVSQSFNEPGVERIPKCDSCSQLLTTQCNATAVLDRVLLELDVLKEERQNLNKECTDGKPCNISGSWNSQVIGMQFNINSSCGAEHELLITIVDHYPPKRACMMDSNWTLVGYALHANGGPFYMAATRSKEEVLATFTGMCRTCTGADTIFGTWNFIKPAKDCRDLLMAVDVKRDVFHKSTLHAKVIEKQKLIKEREEAEADAYL